MVVQESLEVGTHGRGSYEITSAVQAVARRAGVRTGLCHVFIHHTSASLMLCENADPSVRADLEAFMQRLVPDGDPLFGHTLEGPDDMPAHVRTVLTDTSLTLPVNQGACLLGTWQGVFVWEHRDMSHRRRITVTVQGD